MEPLQTPTGAPPQPGLVDQIIALLARPPRVEGIELDTRYFAPAGDDTTRGNASRSLLPAGIAWHSPASSAAQAAEAPEAPLVPLQLCEFLAYKTALAYETPVRVEKFLTECCDGYSHIKFFDSAHTDASNYGKLADAQGYGFVFERKAFVLFRGTSSFTDWQINSTDALTDDLFAKQDRRLQDLRDMYGPLLNKLGDPEPGRHVGFSIAWAALKDEVEDWLAARFENREIDQIIYSGHSLGGAMAQVAAFDHARIADAIGKDRDIKLDHIAAVVTFGAPAVGSKEFAGVYKELLGPRTVLLESSGDLVPRIMNRWYYRMLYPLRQRIKAGVQLHHQENDAFGKVATPWSFNHEPPLSNDDIDAALRVLGNAAERIAKEVTDQTEKLKKEVEEKAERERKEAEAKEAKAKAEAGDKPDAPTANDASASPADASKPKPTTGSTKPAADEPSWGYWLLIGLAAIAAALIIWYFVRRKLFSHDIEQRYALYLSTLSYQQLRAKHGGDLKLANSELDQHLRFVRGDLKKGAELAKTVLDSQKKPTPYFGSVLNLPVTIEMRNDPLFVEYLKKNETFI